MCGQAGWEGEGPAREGLGEGRGVEEGGEGRGVGGPGGRAVPRHVEGSLEPGEQSLW